MMWLPCLLIALPLTGALCAWLVRSNNARPLVLVAAGCLHLPLSLAAVFWPRHDTWGAWLYLDAIGKVFLLEISLLYTACACYAVGYLRSRSERDNRVLCMGMLVCLAAMTLTAASRHLGLLWLAIAASTLTMAPLVYFNRNARSIEATWKFMMIGSVGIALALLGVFFLAYSTMVAGLEPTLQLEQLIQQAHLLPTSWLKAAYVLMLVGFGTKMGLVPMHTWKPDAYGEAPGLVGAMLAGGLANCGFIGLIRIHQITAATTLASSCSNMLIGIGLFSIAVATIFLVRQTDFKRMLAYSSVEHMGLFALALGLGGKALYGIMLHVIGNGLGKGMMFMVAGNINRAFGSKSREVARGALVRMPWSGALFLAGFFAVTGSPPFVTFASEFSFFSASFSRGGLVLTLLLGLLMSIAFLGMAQTVLPVVFGNPPATRERTKYRDSAILIVPPLALLLIGALAGLWLPEPLHSLFIAAAALLEVKP